MSDVNYDNLSVDELAKIASRINETLEKKREETRGAALIQAKQLIADYKFTASDLGLSVAKAGKAAKGGGSTVETYDFKAHGFVLGSVYKGVVKNEVVYYQLGKGRQPLWLIEAARAGKKHAELLASDEETKTYLASKTPPPAPAPAPSN